MLCKHQVIGSIPIGSTSSDHRQCEALPRTELKRIAFAALLIVPEMKTRYSPFNDGDVRGPPLFFDIVNGFLIDAVVLVAALRWQVSYIF